MTTLYLVRHAQPASSAQGRHICLGRTDVPLSEEGKRQAHCLARYFKGKQIDGIFSSPLSRCTETAEILKEESGHSGLSVQTAAGLAEVDTGEWDGLDFSEIRKKYPAEYEERGRHPGRYVISGGESPEDAGKRFALQIEMILRENCGMQKNFLVTAHAGVIQAFLCMLTETDIDSFKNFNVPYASVTAVEFSGELFLRGKETRTDGTSDAVAIRTIGLRPMESITFADVERMWAACGVKEKPLCHMKAVADMALKLIGYDAAKAKYDQLETAYYFHGNILNTRVLYYAALLHDVKRSSGGQVHADEGAEYLAAEGWLELSETVARHHDPSVYCENGPVTEAEILYLADKMVQENRPVTIEERFENSKRRCLTVEALAANNLRYLSARGILSKLESAAGDKG